MRVANQITGGGGKPSASWILSNKQGITNRHIVRGAETQLKRSGDTHLQGKGILFIKLPAISAP